MKVGYLRKAVISKAATPQESNLGGGGDLGDLAASFWLRVLWPQVLWPQVLRLHVSGINLHYPLQNQLRCQ
jgi:hypothetical protein